jgi:NitT/TauT family transport system ATP-binding protein
MLEVENVYVSFVSVKGLDGVSLTIQAGEIICLIGPSGCGKSTLLNVLAGLLPPSRGRIRCYDDGREQSVPDMGMVFQDLALFPWLTVIENVEFGLKLRRVEPAQRRTRALECLDLVGLSHAVDMYPYQISGGMKQRVAIARAICLRPKILLMDEPFSALDAWTRRDLQDFLVKLNRATNLTIVFVTHDLNEGAYIGDRVAVMSEGRIRGVFRNPLPDRMGRRFDPAIHTFESLLDDQMAVIRKNQAGAVSVL